MLVFQTSLLLLSCHLLVTISAHKLHEGDDDVVDYRRSKCMPPVAPELNLVKALKAKGGPPCIIFSRPIAAVAMAEFYDCLASPRQSRRDFSELQVIECSLPKLTSCGSLPSSKPISGMDYIINIGLELNQTYAAKDAKAGTTGRVCDSDSKDIVFKFNSGVTTVGNTESAIAEALRSNGPVLVNLYMNSTRAFSDLTGSLKNYKYGILNNDFLCPPGSPADLLQIDPVKGFEAVKMPATIVGYERIREGCGEVNVWIVRMDYFGSQWGMNGYFYLRRDVNACNIIANPMQILG